MARKTGKKGASGRGKKKTASATARFLTPEQEREILGICLLVLAAFLLLSLVPVSWFGSRGYGWFPSGNLVGVLGGAAHGLQAALLGRGGVLLPGLLVVLGLWTADWISRDRGIRLTILVTGLMLVIPVLLETWVPGAAAGGWVGARVGRPLAGGVGVLGSTLIGVSALVALSVGTLGWNPLKTLGVGLRRVGEVIQGAAAWLAARARKRAEARKPDVPLVQEAWTGPETGEDEEPAPSLPVPAPEPATPPAAEPKPRKKTPVAEDLPDPADPRDLTGGELPPEDLLTIQDGKDRADMERELDGLGEILVEKLRTFNVECSLGGRTTGPVVTQFEVVPAPGVKVNRIANLDADLALAMRAASIRIVAPIPGKGAVGVEIPNPFPEIVHLRAILEAREFTRAKGVLPLALGDDLTGKPYVADLAKMPHLLIAGATGAGKSVCINTIITSLVYRHTPETLRFLMIDPKMVELSAYADLPHLRHPVVTDPHDAAGVLKWAVLEMERRYQLLKENGARSVAEFNRKVRDGVLMRRPEPEGEEGDPDRHIYDDGPLPYLVVVVDELADLMMQVQSEVERPLAQLAQKARAIGIHLIVATQRPSVNVITGLIKANFPTRIAFRVASKTDSRTILDMNGAEALLGNGDMLFLPPGQSEPVRIQGAFISTEDTERLLGWYRRVMEEREDAVSNARYPSEQDILEELRAREMEEAGSGSDAISGDWDDLFRDAAEVCIQNQGGSTSLLQRRLSIGYGRAARIVDQLHDAGVLGPPDGSKPREVLVTMGELDQLFPGT